MMVSISVICMLLPSRNLSPSVLVSVAPSQAPLLAPILAPCWQATPSSLYLITLPLRAPLRASTLDQCCCGRFVSLAIKSPSQSLKEHQQTKALKSTTQDYNRGQSCTFVIVDAMSVNIRTVLTLVTLCQLLAITSLSQALEESTHKLKQ